ncbi:RHS repeat domain-containing protein [Polaribacter cellanae]|uniref:RHS repeat protein n=1 Tax=Polaribacter cellanae TaxID=2818493 RepID=A0A975H587_9FLAO|nr:RHS repeat domain-containing protein [Polaribacter cellanae]QTE21151.1 hypothetical protein J3359_09835 [Polaribacter cellanae]
MKKNLLIISIVLITAFTNGQSLPTIVPPSPTAFQLTKYGDIQVNEHLGLVNPSVSLFTYKAGKLDVPISMSYNSSGVKVDDAASWTGMNWNLNVGGVITRIVKDLDDLKSTKEFYTAEEIDNLIQNGNRAKVRTHVADNMIDSEVDIFNFSFSGYSGSFFLNPNDNMKPTLLKYDKELDIEFIGSISNYGLQITITTENGDKYFFGGNNGTESTRLLNNGQFGQGLSPTVATSFYLTKIKNFIGDEIYFEYDTLNYYVDLGKKESFSIETSRSDSSTCSFEKIPFQIINSNPQLLTNSILSGRFLKKIHSNVNSHSIDFTRIESHVNSSFHFNNYLKEIVVNESDELVSQSINFEYLFPKGDSNSERFFLKEILFNKNNSTDRKYSFEYKSPENLPKRFSFSQDHFGYFNNKSNTSLLPNNEVYSFKNYKNDFADRRSDFDYASLGILTKITYPTGGNTVFEYESPKIYDDYIYDTTLGLNVHNNVPHYYPKTRLVHEKTIQSKFIRNIRTNIIVSSENDYTRRVEIKISLINLTTNALVETKLIPLDNYLNTSQGVDVNFNNPEKSEKGYKVIAELFNGIDTNNILDVVVHFNYKYTDKNKIVDGPGIRIKKITNNPISGSKIQKVFYYKKLDDIINANNSVNNQFYKPKYYSTSKKLFVINCSSTGTPPRIVYLYISMVNINSNSVNALFGTNYNQIAYDYVTISYGGDNFENGGKQIHYNLLEGKFPSPYLYDSNTAFDFSSSKSNEYSLNGVLLNEIYFKKENELYYKLKEINNEYSTSTYKKIVNNLCVEEFEVPAPGDHNYLNGLYLGIYNTCSFKFSIKNSTIYTFFPKTLYNYTASESNSVVETKEYSYGIYPSLPKEIITTNSMREMLKTKIYYPDDITNLNSLGNNNLSNSEFAAIKKLQKKSITSPLAQNRIAEPIQTERYKNNILLSTQQTIYSEFNELVLPKKIQSSKGSGLLEDRIIYHDYDDKGNPIEVSKKDGTHIIYIWGYNKTQPIAKIENLTSSELTSVISSLSASYNTLEKIQEISNLDNTQGTTTSENNLRTALTALRNALTNTNVQVTTFTYDPLIGVTSVTDPRGRVVYYEYDSFNRLKQVKDHDGNILNKNEYNYKN